MKLLKKLCAKKVPMATVAVLLVAVLIIPSAQGVLRAFASVEYWLNIADGTAFSGQVRLSAAASGSGQLSLKLNDTVVQASSTAASATLHYQTDANTSNTMRAKNKLRFGPTADSVPTTGGLPFATDGQTGIAIPLNSLANGTNHVRVIIGGLYGDDGVYDVTKPHGQAGQGGTGTGYLTAGNYDDFIVQGMYLMMPGGREVFPDSVILYKGETVGQVGYVTETVPYERMKNYWLGDGWPGNGGYPPHNDAVAGSNNSRLDIPFMIDFVFSLAKPTAVVESSLNTTAFADGTYSLKLLDGSTTVLNKTVIIDNTKPVISTNLDDEQIIENGTFVDVGISDLTSGIKVASALFNGEEVGTLNKSDNNTGTMRIFVEGLAAGVYNLTFVAEDKAGNTTYLFRNFHITDNLSPSYARAVYEAGTLSINTVSSLHTVKAYEAQKLDFGMGFGITQDNSNPSYNRFGNYNEYYNYAVGNAVEGVAFDTTLGNPYQSFEVDVAGKTGSLVISFDGGARSGEKFALKAYNKIKGDWVKVAGGEGSKRLSFSLNTAQYAVNGKINIVATTDVVDNGSDRMLWFSDPQYLTRFDDLNWIYDKVMTYSAAEYQAGRAAYMVTTGDIVEDNISSASAVEVRKQWNIAKKAFNYLDEANMPYGIVSGNHDTGTNINSLDYSYYREFFGETVYNTRPWYGGSLNDNINHYDLVTVGGFDFVILYLGYGVEGLPETIAWANSVLQKYAHRNAILATHAYLLGDGTEDPTARWSEMLNYIAKPNPNVVMLLCGHNDGANLKTYDLGGGRKFTVVLSDYQFIEHQTHYEVSHIISGYTCNGEGYMREILISDGRLRMNTFTPAFETDFLPYGVNDTIDMPMEFLRPNRFILTNSFSAVIIGNEAEAVNASDNKFTVNYGGSNAIVAEIFNEFGASSLTFAFASSVPAAPAKPTSFNHNYEVYCDYLKLLQDLSAKLQSEGAAPYTEASFNRFRSALTAAEEMAVSSQSSASEIYDAFAVLMNAYDLLTDVPDPNTPSGCQAGCSGNSAASTLVFAGIVATVYVMLRRRAA